MAQRRVPLFNTTEDQTLRIQKELAVKIGFNEAVILMQIEYLISITDNERDGNWWTWQTLEELKENSFPWWSIATISRALKSLKEQGIIFIDSFNKRKGDKTQWFALNIEKVKELGINLNEKHPIFQNEKWVGGDTIMKEEESPKEEKGPVTEPESAPEQLPIFQIDGTIFQNAIPIFQIETTLPETPTKIPPENISPNGDSGLPPPEDSKKWNKANKKIVGDRFLELSHLKPPVNKKTAGAWWGWLFEIFEMSNKDPIETCQVMEIVVDHMRGKHLDITSPKSLINYSRVVASGQELNGNGHHSTGQNKNTGRESGSRRLRPDDDRRLRDRFTDPAQGPDWNPYSDTG